MGADGGTIPRRDELVRTKKKPEKIDKNVENATKWKQCAMSQQPLREPIVACRLGRLYNKESVIESLLDKAIEPNENVKHVASIKDVKVLNFTPNPAYVEGQPDKGDTFKDFNASRYICPVVGLEMNGKHRFLFSWGCGCVISEKALKEIMSDNCHKCGKKWESDGEVILNGTEEEVEGYRIAMLERKQEELQAKKSKKAAKLQKNAKTLSEFKVPNVPGTSSAVDCQPESSSNSLKRKPEVTKEKAGSEKTLTKGPEAKKQKKSSIQDDPKTSKTFKGLFTSSEDGKKQPRAHWVTFNPQYF